MLEGNYDRYNFELEYWLKSWGAIFMEFREILGK